MLSLQMGSYILRLKKRQYKWIFVWSQGPMDFIIKIYLNDQVFTNILFFVTHITGTKKALVFY